MRKELQNVRSCFLRQRRRESKKTDRGVVGGEGRKDEESVETVSSDYSVSVHSITHLLFQHSEQRVEVCFCLFVCGTGQPSLGQQDKKKRETHDRLRA